MKRLLFVLIAAAGLLAGCATLDEKQRQWIFQPSDRSWSRGAEAAAGMSDVWIEFASRESGQPVKLHGLWAPHADFERSADAPILLYLHGARWNVTGSAFRMQRMQELGFSVLGIDYRGFGKSTADLPSEAMAYEDARAAWDWLGKTYPGRPRYIFGHSLGGAVALELAKNHLERHLETETFGAPVFSFSGSARRHRHYLDPVAAIDAGAQTMAPQGLNPHSYQTLAARKRGD